jgi:hypothetical protein
MEAAGIPSETQEGMADVHEFRAEFVKPTIDPPGPSRNPMFLR